jgi:hypothetical protein
LVAARVQGYGATAAHPVNLSQDGAEKWEVVQSFGHGDEVDFSRAFGAALHNDDAKPQCFATR